MRILEEIEDGGDPIMLVDPKFLQAMGKWVLDNGVYAAPDATTEDSPLAARLKEIRAKQTNRVADFRKEAAERGKG